jgi:hypothetical protein
MVAALRQAGFDVVGSDITQGMDFLGQAPETGVNAIITNPPYALAREFIERALHFDAMLLRTDFDHAASREYLFADCPMFAKKVVLTKRIRWFEDSSGSPSFNHCWMIWERQHCGPPALAYARHAFDCYQRQSGHQVDIAKANSNPTATLASQLRSIAVTLRSY